MLALENERRQESQHRIARAVDHDPSLQHLGNRLLRQIGVVQLRREHQSLAANILDALVLLRKPAQLRLEVVAHLSRMRQQSLVLDLVDHRDRHGTGQRTTAKRRSMHSGMNRARRFLGA